jgi:large subunit ribosomal protein L9
MKILLLKDVYKLGRAGDVKKVANGYGRNYLIPQGFAVLATPEAIQQADYIREVADKERAILNEEMSGIAEQMEDVRLTFPVRASETGRLYGSVNTRMIAEAINEELDLDISHRQIDAQPIRMIGEHTIPVRLTVDLIPEIDVVVYREGETPEESIEEAEELAEEAEQADSESVGWADYKDDVLEEYDDLEEFEMEPEIEVEEEEGEEA